MEENIKYIRTDNGSITKVVTTRRFYGDDDYVDSHEYILKMILAVLTLLVALAISAVAAYYSIIGLIAIFSAAVIPIAVMGVVLEAGKLVTAWVYHNWKRTPKLLKGYLISAVVILMFITSMGIFGFLSKAHIEQTTISSDNSLQIELIDRRYNENVPLLNVQRTL